MSSRVFGLLPIGRRRLLAGIAAVALAPARPAAARQEATPPAASGEGAWTFTDDRGVTVDLAQRPRRVAAQITAAAALWDYGIRPVAVFGPHRRVDGSLDPLVGDVDLDAVVSLGEVWGEFDLEKLIAIEPDLLVSTWYGPYHGENTPLWYVPEEAVPVVDERVPSIGILTEDVSIAQAIARFAELAAALGADLEAPEVVAARERYERAVADVKAAIAEKPGLRVLAVNGTVDELYVANPAAAADLLFFRELGLEVVTPDSDPEEYWDTLSWEQANKYPADLILNDVRAHAFTPEQLMEIPTWRELPAVQVGQVAPWRLEPTYSYKGYAPVLEELAAVIRESEVVSRES